VFNVKIRALFLHKNVIKKPENFMFFAAKFSKNYYFWCIPEKIIKISKNIFRIKYHFRPLLKFFLVLCDDNILNVHQLKWTLSIRVFIFQRPGFNIIKTNKYQYLNNKWKKNIGATFNWRTIVSLILCPCKCKINCNYVRPVHARQVTWSFG